MNDNCIRMGFMVAILLAVITSYSVGAIVPIMDFEDDENSEMTAADEQDLWRMFPKKEARSPKPSGSRPKYDPGLKWIGLGKRHYSAEAQLSTVAGLHALHNMKTFFSDLSRQMQQLKNQKNVDRESRRSDDSMPILSKGNGNDNRAIRSKGTKTTYDPSFLWTGLGR